MNCIEVLLIGGLVFFGTIGADITVFGSRLLGGISGVLIGLGTYALTAILCDLAEGGIPRMPKCLKGSCTREDYSGKDYGSESKFCWECKHGDKFRRRGRRFVIVQDDGTEKPYLIWRRFRGWFPDK